MNASTRFVVRSLLQFACISGRILQQTQKLDYSPRKPAEKRDRLSLKSAIAQPVLNVAGSLYNCPVASIEHLPVKTSLRWNNCSARRCTQVTFQICSDLCNHENSDLVMVTISGSWRGPSSSIAATQPSPKSVKALRVLSCSITQLLRSISNSALQD